LTSTKALPGALNFQFPPRNRPSLRSANIRNITNERSKSQANITKVILKFYIFIRVLKFIKLFYKFKISNNEKIRLKSFTFICNLRSTTLEVDSRFFRSFLSTQFHPLVTHFYAVIISHFLSISFLFIELFHHLLHIP